MQSFATLAVLVTIVARAAALTVNTPTGVVQCEPIQFTWTSDGTPPYFLTLIPGGQPAAAPVKEFPETSATEYTWIVDLPSGTSLTAALRDNTGVQEFSDAFTIQASTNSTCLNSAVNEGGSGSTASGATTGASTTGAATSAPGGTTSAGAGTAKSTSSGLVTSKTTGTGSSASTATSPASGSSNAASRDSSMAAFGFAGLMGLIGAALL